MTLLEQLACDGNFALVKEMLADENNSYESNELTGALALAAKNGHEDIVDTLLAYGADPNGDGADRRMCSTALQNAAEIGHLKIFSALFAKGIDPESCSVDIALQYAAAMGHLDIVNFILDTGFVPKKSSPALRGAILGQHYEIIERLLAVGVELNKYPYPLDSAIERDDIESLSILLEHGANPNMSPETLELAAKSGNHDMVKKLLAYGAKPIQFPDALMMAILGKHLEIVKTLLANGADPKGVDINKTESKNYMIYVRAIDGGDFLPYPSLALATKSRPFRKRGFQEAFPEESNCARLQGESTVSNCTGYKMGQVGVEVEIAETIKHYVASLDQPQPIQNSARNSIHVRPVQDMADVGQPLNQADNTLLQPPELKNVFNPLTL